jgi:hypothetical protein
VCWLGCGCLVQLCFELRSLAVFPATVMSHMLYTFTCLRLTQHHLGAYLCRSVTLAVEDPVTCKSGCFINHGAEVAPRGELAQVHVNTMQHLNLLKWTHGWDACTKDAGVREQPSSMPARESLANMS